MRFKSELLVMGAKMSKGDYQGKPFDYTQVFYQADLQDGENFVGQVGESMRFGSSDNFEKLKGLSYPCLFDVEIEQVSNGNSTTLIILDMKPKSTKVPLNS